MMPSLDLTKPEPLTIRRDYINAALQPASDLPDPLLIQIHELNREYHSKLLEQLKESYGPKIIKFLEQGRACIYTCVPPNNVRIDSFGNTPDGGYSHNIPLEMVAKPNIGGNFLQSIGNFFPNHNAILSQPVEGYSSYDLLIDIEAAHELGIAPTAIVASNRFNNLINKLANQFSEHELDTSGNTIKAITAGTWPYVPKP